VNTSKKLGLAIGGLVAIQLIPVPRSNPAVEHEIPAPAPVREILQRACYDCHSFATVWPWYAYVAPASWLVAWDVHDGRQHLNFHRWFGKAKARADKLDEIVEEVDEEEMPLWFYLPLHPEAQLTRSERETLMRWAEGLAAQARAEADAGG